MTLFNNLGTLESAGLIQVAKVEPDLEYLFRHSLVQDAAYASLLESDRKRLHLSVGNAIENLYPERKHEMAGILAYHFKEAGENERALAYFIIAGDEALKVYANLEAEYQYRRALELLCCSGEYVAWLYSGLGEALYRQSRMQESLDALNKGIEIYRSIANWDGVARLYARKARVTWYAFNRPEGLRVALEGWELVKDAPGSPGKAALMHETARAYYFNGMSDKALPLCRQALQLAEELGAVNVQADTLATMGILPGVKPDESLHMLRKAVELSESHGLLQIAMRANQNLGTMIQTWQADRRTAMKYFARAAEHGRMRGVASEEMIGAMSYTACLFPEGKIKEIEARVEHMQDLARNIADPKPALLSITFMKALLTGYKGDWEAALVTFKECYAQWRILENLESQIYMLDELSWVLLEKNRWEGLQDLGETESYLQQAQKIIEKDDSNESMWLYPRFCMLKARQGRLEEAHQWLDKAIQRMENSPSAWDERIKLECELEILTASHDWSRALAVVEELVGRHRRLGLTYDLSRSLLCWAELLLLGGETAAEEKAQPLIGESLQLTKDMGEGYYHRIAERMLQQTRVRLHAQTLNHAQMTRELKKARQVQESLLPENTPNLPGWQLEVVLKPAHETSGDFYDFLPFTAGKTGLVIADVTDKGTSAALFMALGRSLWRTFAVDHPDEPALTMAETNRRILADTHGGLYISLFYAVLEPSSGSLIYCNAGHLPGLLLRVKDGSIERLETTGMPLGALEDAEWKQRKVVVGPGDCLVLYTDGITEAQNEAEEFFGQDRLEDALKTQLGRPAREVRDAILAQVAGWVGQAPQFDDITLMVVSRILAVPTQ
jgi:serine phosphatase RsbU (regulator of sigma subunit)